MGGILGGLTKALFGSPKAPKPDWDVIERMMRLDTELNRTDQNGIFGGWNWNDDKTAQSQFISPELQPALDAFYQRSAQGSQDPQLQELMQARFASMMNRPGPAPRPEQRERPTFARPVPRSDRGVDEGPPPDWWRR